MTHEGCCGKDDTIPRINFLPSRAAIAAALAEFSDVEDVLVKYIEYAGPQVFLRVCTGYSYTGLEPLIIYLGAYDFSNTSTLRLLSPSNTLLCTETFGFLEAEDFAKWLSIHIIDDNKNYPPHNNWRKSIYEVVLESVCNTSYEINPHNQLWEFISRMFGLKPIPGNFYVLDRNIKVTWYMDDAVLFLHNPWPQMSIRDSEKLLTLLSKLLTAYAKLKRIPIQGQKITMK